MKKLFNLVTALVILHSIFYLAGCSSYKKQAARFHNFAYAHPDELARDCAKQFPVRDSLVKGTEQIYVDSTVSFWTPGNFISTGGNYIIGQPVGDTASGCPVKIITKTYIKTIRSVDTIYRESMARIDTLVNHNKVQSLQLAKAQQQVAYTETDRDRYKKLALTRLFIIIGLGIILLGLLAWKVYKFFTGGFIKKVL